MYSCDVKFIDSKCGIEKKPSSGYDQHFTIDDNVIDDTSDGNEIPV